MSSPPAQMQSPLLKTFWRLFCIEVIGEKEKTNKVIHAPRHVIY